MNLMDIGPATTAFADGSFLVYQFRDFCTELVEWKRVLARELASRRLRPGADEAKVETADARTVSHQLLAVLQLQALEARRLGGRFSLDNIEEAQYLKAAVADEILVNLDWPGRADWTSNLIETALFQSRVAGEQVFERMDELLRGRDPSKRPLAVLYLLALALDFQGKYRGTDCAARLAGYARELYRFVYSREPAPETSERLFASQAYEFTLRDVKPQKLPDSSRWVAVLLLVVAVMLGASQLLWTWKAAPLEAVIAAGEARAR